MTDDSDLNGSHTIVATIENEKDPTQSVTIHYLKEENAFVTSGIKAHFEEREILIPAYLVIMDLRLMGAIVSSILEKLSEARESEGTFQYVSQFDALEKRYNLAPYGDYVRLSEAVD